jgi:hypothetical protein
MIRTILATALILLAVTANAYPATVSSTSHDSGMSSLGILAFLVQAIAFCFTFKSLNPSPKSRRIAWRIFIGAWMLFFMACSPHISVINGVFTVLALAFVIFPYWPSRTDTTRENTTARQSSTADPMIRKTCDDPREPKLRQMAALPLFFLLGFFLLYSVWQLVFTKAPFYRAMDWSHVITGGCLLISFIILWVNDKRNRR